MFQYFNRNLDKICSRTLIIRNRLIMRGWDSDNWPGDTC